VRAPVRALVVIAESVVAVLVPATRSFARRGRAGHQARVMLDDLRGQPRVAVTVDDHVTRRDRRQSAAPSEPEPGASVVDPGATMPVPRRRQGLVADRHAHERDALRRLVVRIAADGGQQALGEGALVGDVRGEPRADHAISDGEGRELERARDRARRVTRAHRHASG